MSVSGLGRRRIADGIESWIGDSAARGPAGLAEGITVDPLPDPSPSRTLVIQRGSHSNRFASQWLIAAYEKIVPSSLPTTPSLARPGPWLDGIIATVENVKEIS